MVVRESAQPGAVPMDGRANLLLAEVRAGNGNEVRGLLSSGVDANSREVSTHDTAPALYVAACRNSHDVAFSLLHYGADVNASTSWGNRPIHAAADLGYEGILTLLLKHNDARGRVIDVNARNDNGDTALHLAAARGHLRICKSLLSHKADPWTLNNRGRTARDEASSNGKSAVFQELYRHRHNDEDSEPKALATAPIQRRSPVHHKEPLFTEPVRVMRPSREPVESEDTSSSDFSSYSSSSPSSISSSSSSSSSLSLTSSSSRTSTSSSRTSSYSTPSTSISLTSSRDIQTDRSVMEIPEFTVGQTSLKAPLRTESVSRVTNGLTNGQDNVDSGKVGICTEGPPSSKQIQNKVVSGHPDDSAFSSYFEEIQLVLVRKEDQLQMLKNHCQMLVKKLAEKEEENALLRSLLKNSSLSHKFESRSSAS